MALQTKTYTGSMYKGYLLWTLTITEDYTSVSGNWSAVSYKLTVRNQSVNKVPLASINAGVLVDGSFVKSKVESRGWNSGVFDTLTWVEGTSYVPHNSDGTRRINVAFKAGASYDDGYSSAQGGGAIDLTLIRRPNSMTLSAEELTAGAGSVNFSITKQKESYTSTITWAYGSKSGTILERSSDKSASWSPDPSVLYSEGLEGDVTFTLTTYNGTSQVSEPVTYTMKVKVPEVSTVSRTNADIGKETDVFVTRSSDIYTHTVRYVIGSVSGTVAEKSASVTIPLTVPTSVFALLGDNPSIAGTLYIKTFYEDKQVGAERSAVLVALAGAGSTPVISNLSVRDVNSKITALTGDSKKYIVGASTIRVTASVSARNTAHIVSTSVNGVSGGDSGAVSIDFENATASTYNLVATDNRGLVVRASDVVTAVLYMKVTNQTTLTRPMPTDGSARITMNGIYDSRGFGAQGNALTLKYRVREKGASAWSSWVTIPASSITYDTAKYSYTAVVNLEGYDYQKVYEFETSANDKVRSDVNVISELKKGEPVFEWNDDIFVHRTSVSAFTRLIKNLPVPYYRTSYSVEDADTGEYAEFF